jgi:hypothetical protein
MQYTKSSCLDVEPAPSVVCRDSTPRAYRTGIPPRPQSPLHLKGSILKAVVVDILRHTFELSPALALSIGRRVLVCWPGFREA